MPKVEYKVKRFFTPHIPESFHCIRNSYTWATWRKDLVAGITVGIIALPLAMAFAIASGVSPERGLYTAIIAGFLISLLGGSRLQIGGPTGAFVVIVYGVVQRHGYEGLVLATLLAGILLVIAGFCRAGALLKAIPPALVVGFTAGIATILLSTQVKDFFGLQPGTLPADFIGKWLAYIEAWPTRSSITCFVGLGTLAAIFLLRRYLPRLPWGIIALVFATLVVWGSELPVETIGSRFSHLPRTLPLPGLPDFSLDWVALLPDVLAIAFLGGIESLLSAAMVDEMAGTRHNAHSELVGQGLANIGSVFFGGIPATGALARTAANAKLGAQTPVSGMIHALTLLLALFFLEPLLLHIPLAALSAVLFVIAWNMCEGERLRTLLKVPTLDTIIFAAAFFLTVLVDLTVALISSMLLAKLLRYARRYFFPEQQE